VAHRCRRLACMRSWHPAVPLPGHRYFLTHLPRSRIHHKTMYAPPAMLASDSQAFPKHPAAFPLKMGTWRYACSAPQRLCGRNGLDESLHRFPGWGGGLGVRQGGSHPG
jgi:hypothetical protein